MSKLKQFLNQDVKGNSFVRHVNSQCTNIFVLGKKVVGRAPVEQTLPAYKQLEPMIRRDHSLDGSGH